MSDDRGRKRYWAGQKYSRRRRMPNRRVSASEKFYTNGLRLNGDHGRHPFHVTTGYFEDGTLGEVFINMNVEGNDFGNMVDAFAKIMSLAFQYGTPPDEIIEALVDFEDDELPHVLAKIFAQAASEPYGGLPNGEPPVAKRELLQNYLSDLIQESLPEDLGPKQEQASPPSELEDR